VALGEGARVRGFALAGATVVVAEDVAGVIEAYEALEADVGLLVMTPAAAEVVSSRLDERPHLLSVVMP